MLKIGDFSRLSHLTVKALRFYEKERLLIPASVDEWTGYRYYETSNGPATGTMKPANWRTRQKSKPAANWICPLTRFGRSCPAPTGCRCCPTKQKRCQSSARKSMPSFPESITCWRVKK